MQMSWLWKIPFHINILESHAFVSLLRSLLEPADDQRFSTLLDSRVAKGSRAKGRSSARALRPSRLLHTSFQVACAQQQMPQLVTVTCLRLPGILSAKQFQQQEPGPFMQLDFPDMLPAGSGSPSCCLFCHVPRLTGCLDFPISLVQCASIRWILDFPLLLHFALRIFGLSASLGLFLLIFAGGFWSEYSQSLVFRGGLGPRVPSDRSF